MTFPKYPFELPFVGQVCLVTPHPGHLQPTSRCFTRLGRRTSTRKPRNDIAQNFGIVLSRNIIVNFAARSPSADRQARKHLTHHTACKEGKDLAQCFQEPLRAHIFTDAIDIDSSPEKPRKESKPELAEPVSSVRAEGHEPDGLESDLEELIDEEEFQKEESTEIEKEKQETTSIAEDKVGVDSTVEGGFAEAKNCLHGG